MARKSKTKEPPVAGYVVVRKLGDAAKFYAKVFGAREDQRYQDPSGKVWFGQMKLLGYRLLLMEPMPDMQLVPRQRKILSAAGGDSSMLSLDVPNVDDTFKRAVRAGATPIIKPYDAHWGDRYAEFRDPFGFRWSCCTTKEDLSVKERTQRFDEFRREHGNLKSPAPVVLVKQR